jgi:hypothetical protein
MSHCQFSLVVEMTSSASGSVLGSEFDDFLFAAIGEERNDLPLSVLSALARLDIDAWQEAAELARLPEATATKRLASLIASLPEVSSAHLDPGEVAVRLTTLLPRGASPDIASREILFGIGAATARRAMIYITLINVIFTFFIIGTRWIARSHQPPTQVDSAHVPASSKVLPQILPPNSGQ